MNRVMKTRDTCSDLRWGAGEGGDKNLPGFLAGAQSCMTHSLSRVVPPYFLQDTRVQGHFHDCPTHQTDFSSCLLLMKCCKLSISRRKPKVPTSFYGGLDESPVKFTSVFLLYKIDAISRLLSQQHHPAKSAINCYLFLTSNNEVILFP